MSMKLEESEEKINELVKQRMKDLHNKGQYDLSQSPEEYEKIIQKLEAEVRNHISVQQQMKLYIESYQSKVEELEPIEDNLKELASENSQLRAKNKNCEKDVDQIKTLLRSKKEGWEKKQGEFKRMMVEKEREYDMKVEELEIKVKDLECKLDKNKVMSRHELKSKHFHKKNEQSVDIPESQKNMYYSFFDNVQKGNVIISKKNKRGELILLKDESNKKKADPSNKLKYFFHGMPGGSVRAKNENEEAFVSFTELSSKGHDKSKVSSTKKKSTPYRIDYYHYSGDGKEQKKLNTNKSKGRGGNAHNLSTKKYEYPEDANETHKRSKSQTINSIK
jgi:hypothetical protein